MGVADTRARILEAALALFAEAGYRGTSIPQVMERAAVSASSLYRLFPSKEVLINEVFRDAKGRLARALQGGMTAEADPERGFAQLWTQLAAFARAEPIAFRFLELQDHVQYLDGESRQLELAVLAPLYLACLDFQRRGAFRGDVSAETIMAFVWGAFVGLVKADRLGYARFDEAQMDAARDACFRAFAADGTKRGTPRGKKGGQRWKRSSSEKQPDLQRVKAPSTSTRSRA